MSTTAFDELLDRIATGGDLRPGELAELSSAPDILRVGMLADALRRRLHGTRATFVRVATVAVDSPLDAPIDAPAGDVIVTGCAAALSEMAASVRRIHEWAGDRPIEALAWSDVERLAEGTPGGIPNVLGELRAAGLDAIAHLPLDAMTDPAAAVAALQRAGFTGLRLTVHQDRSASQPGLWTIAADLQRRFGCIHTLSPLPRQVASMRPTTGYQDVKAVALARLSAPEIPVVQVDWSRYGPKLAQVALTFGADDLWGVSSSDAAPEGRRRAPLEEVRRNIEAAGFEPVQRDGRYHVS